MAQIWHPREVSEWLIHSAELVFKVGLRLASP